MNMMVVSEKVTNKWERRKNMHNFLSLIWLLHKNLQRNVLKLLSYSIWYGKLSGSVRGKIITKFRNEGTAVSECVQKLVMTVQQEVRSFRCLISSGVLNTIQAKYCVGTSRLVRNWKWQTAWKLYKKFIYVIKYKMHSRNEYQIITWCNILELKLVTKYLTPY
jgi:hypothetical protein